MIDLGDVIDAEAVPVVLQEKAGGHWNDDGDWVGETLTPETIQAVVQPATGRALKDLPEGEREQARFLLWSRHPLRLDNLIIYAGDAYRINYVWPRPEGGFTRAAMGLMK